VSKWCYAELQEFQRRWISLFRAVALRDAARMAEDGAQLLATQPALGAEPREYLLVAAMAGHLAMGDKAAALKLWSTHGKDIRSADRPVFRLLRCHADPAGCAAAFRTAAEH
jgi:hypothetical protein